MNNSTSTGVDQQSLYYRYLGILSKIASNPDVPLDILIELSNADPLYSIDILEGLASNIKLPINIIEKLSSNNSPYVLSKLALNPNTPISLLIELSHKKENDERLDEDETSGHPIYSNKEIRKAVAQNENTPIHILEKLFIDKSRKVRESVLVNKKLPTDFLTNVSSHEDCRIRELVAKHANTSKDILSKLSKDENKTTEIGHAFGSSFLIRVAVAKNPNTPSEILEQLGQDDNWRVKKAVSEVKTYNKNESLYLSFKDF